MSGARAIGGSGHDDTERQVESAERGRVAVGSSERDAQAVLDTLLDPVVRIHPHRDERGVVIDFTYVNANSAARAHLGRSGRDLVGARMFESGPMQRTGVPFDAFVASVETGGQLQVDDFAVDAGGRTVHFSYRGAVISGDLVVTWRDTTEQVRSAAMLRDSEARYRQLAEHAADIVERERVAREALEASEARYRVLAENASDVVGELDTDGNLVWASNAIASLYDWHPEITPALSLPDFVLPDDLPVAEETMAALVRDGRERTVSLRTVSGHGVMRWMSVRARPVRDAQGAVISIVVALSDIDNEVKAHERLEESEEHLRRIVENAQDVVVLSDETKRITWVSPSIERVLGWRVEQVIGTPLRDLMHPDDAAKVASVREALYDHEHPRPQNERLLLRLRGHDGHYRWMSAGGTPVVGPDGTFVSLVSTLSDVDALVHTTEELAEQRLRLQVTLDSLLDPHLIVSAKRDDAGQIIDFTFAEANRAACDYLHMTSEQLIGARLRDLVPDAAATGMLALCIRAVETGEPLIRNDVAYEHELLGSRRSFDIRGIKEGDGLSITWRDVSDRHTFGSG